MKKMNFIVLLAIGFLFASTQFVTAQEDKEEVKETKTEIEVDGDEMEIKTKKTINLEDIKEKPAVISAQDKPNRVDGEGAKEVIEVEEIEEIEMEDDDDNDKRNQKILSKKLIDER